MSSWITPDCFQLSLFLFVSMSSWIAPDRFVPVCFLCQDGSPLTVSNFPYSCLFLCQAGSAFQHPLFVPMSSWITPDCFQLSLFLFVLCQAGSPLTVSNFPYSCLTNVSLTDRFQLSLFQLDHLFLSRWITPDCFQLSLFLFVSHVKMDHP